MAKREVALQDQAALQTARLAAEQAFLSVEQQCAPADLLRSLQTQLSGSIRGIPPGLCNDEFVTGLRAAHAHSHMGYGCGWR